MRLSFFVLVLAVAAGQPAVAQNRNWGAVAGRVTESETGGPVPGATVLVRGTNYGTAADDDGRYVLRLPVGRHVVQVSAVGFGTVADTVGVAEGRTARHDVVLPEARIGLDEVVVAAPAVTGEAGVHRIDPERIADLPATFHDGYRILKSMPGVTSNNELSNRYAVRGGGYDENLVFVDGYEVFQPYRPRKGEHEGMGLVNPDLAGRYTFYTGGFPARYGGKLSSALDVRYRVPGDTAVTGNAYVSLLGVGASAGARAAGGRLTWLAGVRRMATQRLFGSQELQGAYEPRYADVQGVVTFRLAPRHTLEGLAFLARNRFVLHPVSRTTHHGNSIEITETLFDYTGREEAGYETGLAGVRLRSDLSAHVRMEHDAAIHHTAEAEAADVRARTEVNLVTFDPGTFEPRRTPMGRFEQVDRADNAVRGRIVTGRGRYLFTQRRRAVEAGWHVRGLNFDDRLLESQAVSQLNTFPDTLDPALLDSLVQLGYFTRPDTSFLRQFQGTAALDAVQAGGYAEGTFDLMPEPDRLVVVAGLRADYFSFNGEWTVSPRASVRYRAAPHTYWSVAAGVYHQAPSYRELRGDPVYGQSLGASLDRGIRSQRSVQVVAGVEHFAPASRLSFRGEVFYKRLSRLISYDLVNVRTAYAGANDSEGYAWGVDAQVRGEFVPGFESWASYSYLVARERFLPAYRTAFNSGWLARPVDQRHTFVFVIQDYLPRDPTWRLNLRLLYGTGYPYTRRRLERADDGTLLMPPGRRNASRGPIYLRTDIGAGKRLTWARGPGRAPIQVDLSAELLNMWDTVTAVDYLWVPVDEQRLLGVPTRTSPRTFNLRARVVF